MDDEGEDTDQGDDGNNNDRKKTELSELGRSDGE